VPAAFYETDRCVISHRRRIHGKGLVIVIEATRGLLPSAMPRLLRRRQGGYGRGRRQEAGPRGDHLRCVARQDARQPIAMIENRWVNGPSNVRDLTGGAER
jgi:hypothetical protein